MSSIASDPCDDDIGDYACSNGSTSMMMMEITETMIIAKILSGDKELLFRR